MDSKREGSSVAEDVEYSDTDLLRRMLSDDEYFKEYSGVLGLLHKLLDL